LYEDHVTFAARAWDVKVVPAFEFEVNEPETLPIYYTVRNSLDYPYARLFVNYSLHDSTGLVLERKLVGSYLFDQKTGEPFGQSGLGDVFDHRFVLSPGFAFPAKGKYQVRLEQFMRQDTLPGVLAVGVRVEKPAKP
jgi:gliding motility-associated lipoprotein GldH